MDRALGSTENARTARVMVLVDPVTGAAVAPVPAGSGSGAPQVQGAAAANATFAGNPVLAGG